MKASTAATIFGASARADANVNMWADAPNGPIDLEHYEKAGTIQHALSMHADEALTSLSDESITIAKRMFQALTRPMPPTAVSGGLPTCMKSRRCAAERKRRKRSCP